MEIKKEPGNHAKLRTIVWLVVVMIASATAVFLWRQSSDPYRGKMKAQRISCVNNLKQLGLALRVWSGDNDDKYPFNVSTNSGGAMELCTADHEGFILNSTGIFKAIQWELSTPRILVCPKDRKRQAAPNFETLSNENITYRIRELTNVTENPPVVLIVCPIDGHILYSDGSVTGDDMDPNAMRVP